MQQLQGRTIVVTGGAQGLGREIVRAAGAEGAFVVVIDVDAAGLASVEAELGAAACATFACDIRDAAAVGATVRAIRERFRAGVAALVNNAGVYTNDAIEAADPDRAVLAFAVNVQGTMNVTNATLSQQLLDPDSGQIVFVNSSAGDPLATAMGASERTYAATKGALTAYAKSVTGACKGTGIRVTTIFPGGMDTNLYANAGMAAEVSHGQSWMMSPRRVASTVAFVLAMPPDTVISRISMGPNLR
ncbi:SDR family oxidoreductase [Pseudonocardia sp. CA-107938]|uniref:SDR family oxidoreductase n=1 Tax=Pseudonocardia sp. CA-107938 TaxID=3240021 RepID=UPI003D93763B